MHGILIFENFKINKLKKTVFEKHQVKQTYNFNVDLGFSIKCLKNLQDVYLLVLWIY